jgi:hypothetical protein
MGNAGCEACQYPFCQEGVWHDEAGPAGLAPVRREVVMKRVVTICFFICMSHQSSWADLTTGLVGYWNFDEGSGATANDLSGNNNDGTITGATWTSSGMYGGALNFDGTNDYVMVPDDDSLDLSGGMTIAAWINSGSTSGPRVIAAKWDDNIGQHSYIFKDHDSGSNLRIELWGLADIAGTAGIVTGSWIHVAATFDSSTVKLYYNGVEDASAVRVGSIPASTSALRIGAVATGGTVTQNFMGLMDEVYIYDRALSVDEINTLKSAPVPVPPALLLGSIGIALASWRLRKRKTL